MLGTMSASAVDVEVTVENLAPANGGLLTPVWVGFHDGTFDPYNSGEAASAALERLAEDGNTGPLATAFDTSMTGSVEGTLDGIGPIAPGASVSKRFRLNATDTKSRYFSYVSMVIPSNDAFVANGDPMAWQIFDESGNFLGADFMIMGSAVLDAGTEMDDELADNTAFLGQAAPDTGVMENGTVGTHPGFKAAGMGGILDGTFMGHTFENADFKAANYQVARVTVRLVPKKATPVTVKVENLAPANGNYLTPVWVGFHSGGFDVQTMGEAASAGLERLAEDGNAAVLSEEFQASGYAGAEDVITSGGTIPPLAPGQIAARTWVLDGNNSLNRYLSYASMVIPSNDAFVANGDPMAIEIFDEMGNLKPGEYLVMGSMVYDAGTEVNDEVPANTAFLAQAAPNTGDTEGSPVQPHPGFMAAGAGGILDEPMFANADFTATGYRVLRITVQAGLEITGLTPGIDTAELSWQGGMVPFQLQARDSFSTGDWTDLGEPLSTMSTTVALGGETSFFRVEDGMAPQSQTARYTVTFNATWSAATHPTDFPGGPHFSGLIGATHSATFSMWGPGALATVGVKNMAETGGKAPLQSELETAIGAGMAETLLSGGGINPSPGTVNLTFEISMAHPLVSLTSMIAPSPDWFVGVHDLNLFANGSWASELVVPLFPYDAGTDDGATYTSANSASNPAVGISRITGAPLSVGGSVPPLGTFTFIRVE